MNDYDLIIFSLDGTLCRYPGTDLMPGRKEFFERLPEGIRVAIATNQGGVGYRRWLETAKSDFATEKMIARYPTQAGVEKRLLTVVGNIEPLIGRREVAIYMCFAYQFKSGAWAPPPSEAYLDGESLLDRRWRQNRRKPEPGMLLAAMKFADAIPERMLFVGNDDNDKEAARRAGCAYQDEEEFFRPYKVQLKLLYTADFVYGWLLPKERIGLDIFGTLSRFEKKVRAELGNWEHIGSVECRRVEEEGLAFRLEPRPDPRTEQVMGRIILDLDINKHWLVYESPQAHARALWNTRAVNLRVTLSMDIEGAYGIASKQARELIQAAAEEARENLE